MLTFHNPSKLIGFFLKCKRVTLLDVKPRLCEILPSVFSSTLQNVTYVQGQSPEPKIREYFYYIDHQGMLFLDDTRIKNFTSCFKDRKFLAFFFSRLRLNTTERYPEFPFYSPCGRERNFVRCDDLPIVYTHISDDQIFYAYAGDDLKELFQPNMINMQPESGRVYHPAREHVGGAGLIKSSLAIELSSKFEFQNGDSNPPTHFLWNKERHKLINWYNPSKSHS